MNPQVPAGACRYTCRSYPYPWCLTRAGTVRTLSSPKPAGFDPDMTRMTRARPYEECQDGAVKWVSHIFCFSPSMSKSGGTVVRAPSCRYTRGGVPMIYSPDSTRRTPGAAAAASAYDGAKDVVFMGAGTGSQVQRDTTSNAILAGCGTV